MKNIIKYAGGLLGLVGMVSLQSCDKNFEDINTNPEATAKVYPQYVFTKAEYDGTTNMLNFLLGTMQYTTSYNDVAGFGSKYNAAQISQTYKAFDDGYPKEINELGIVIKSVRNESIAGKPVCGSQDTGGCIVSVASPICMATCHTLRPDWAMIPYSLNQPTIRKALFMPTC